jgi:hypothetical protein
MPLVSILYSLHYQSPPLPHHADGQIFLEQFLYGLYLENYAEEGKQAGVQDSLSMQISSTVKPASRAGKLFLLE